MVCNPNYNKMIKTANIGQVSKFKAQKEDLEREEINLQIGNLFITKGVCFNIFNDNYTLRNSLT